MDNNLNQSQLSIWFIEFRTEIQAIQIFSNSRPNYSYEMNKGLSTSGANALKIETNDIKVSENDLISSMVDEKMAVENPILKRSWKRRKFSRRKTDFK